MAFHAQFCAVAEQRHQTHGGSKYDAGILEESCCSTRTTTAHSIRCKDGAHQRAGTKTWMTPVSKNLYWRKQGAGGLDEHCQSSGSSTDFQSRSLRCLLGSIGSLGTGQI